MNMIRWKHFDKALRKRLFDSFTLTKADGESVSGTLLAVEQGLYEINGTQFTPDEVQCLGEDVISLMEVMTFAKANALLEEMAGSRVWVYKSWEASKAQGTLTQCAYGWSLEELPKRWFVASSVISIVNNVIIIN